MIKRYLTISCLYPSAKSENCMPLISVCGKWLEAAGFIIGNEVSVVVARRGEIIIRAETDEIEERQEVPETKVYGIGSENLTHLN
jgi:HSP20-like domain of unknown function (DUF1813).